MRLTRTNSNYFPDDLPHPSNSCPTTVETHYLQCGCTVQDTSNESALPYALYGDVVSWQSPSSPTAATSATRRRGSASSRGSPPPRSVSPGLAATPSGSHVLRNVDNNFCERSSCGRSLVFNREWNRLWVAHSTEMKEALDDNATFEQFKARIRREATEVTEGLLGRMPSQEQVQQTTTQA
jgi:hypothetical protein